MENQKIILNTLKKYNSNYRYISEWFRKHGVEKSKLSDILEDVGLIKLEDRTEYIWSLESILETTVLNKIYLSEESSLVQEVKDNIEKLYPKIKLSEELFKSLLSSRNYSGINEMRAFTALCNADIDTYNTYSLSDKKMLLRYIIRTLALCNMNIDDLELFYEFIKNITDTQCDEESLYKNMVKQEWRNKDYLIKEFRVFCKSEKPVYVDGIIKIIKENLEKAGLYNKVVQVLESKYNKDDEIETINIDIDEFEISPDVVVDISIENEIEKEINEKNDYKKIKYNLTETLSLLSNLEKNRNDGSVDEYKIKNNELQDEINRLEEENNRLRNEIDVLSSRASATSLKEFIQTMGGREYGYQLTDLYLLSEEIMSDDGNIPGRLINMFALLSAYNIEPYTSGKEIGDIFEIELKELAQKYSLESRIQETNEKIKVQLLKFGWKQNRDILVQPLVKQVL